MIVNKYNKGGGGSISGGSADYATLAGESNKSKLLEGASAPPQSANTGDVVAIAPTPTRGLRSARTLGIYQYDGVNWNKIEGGEGGESSSLEPLSQFPQSAKTGEVVAISSVKNVYDSVIIPSKTLAFEGNDVLIITTEYGTLTVNTYEKGGNIIYFETNDGNSSDIIAVDGETTSLPTNDENYIWEMEYDSDVYIRITENNTPVCVFSQDSLANNTCFAYLDGNYEQITTLGLYQYDGSVWNQVGENGGDNTILKAVSGAPATVEDGDVFAVHTPSADTQYEVSAWTETGEYTISFDHHVQAIKVHIKTNGHFDFGFNNNDGWHDGFGFDIVADGKYGYVFYVQDYDGNRWEVSEQSIKFIASEWMAKTDGKTLYLDIREDNGDYYLYIYTEDVSKIWITDVTQNTIDGEVQEGTVIPAHGDIDKVFQASIKTEPNVKIELEGNARVDGTLDNPTQIVTMSDGQMKISFYDNSNVQGVICDLESNGAYFHLYYDVSTDGWTLFDSDGENVLIKIQDGESGDADFGDGNVYLSYSDGVLTAYTDNEKGWKNWDMGDSHTVVISNELAKVPQLPTKKQLIPDFNAQGGDGEKVLVTDYWNPDTAVWQERSNFVNAALRDIDNYSERPDGAVLTKLDEWNFGWRPIDQTILEPKSSLPVESEDGVVYALSSSGYGIYQAQSAHTGYDWFNLEGKTIPQGVITKFRVPYTDTAESNFVHIKTDPNGSGEMNLYWHPENPDNKYWDIGDPNGMNQYSAEFSLTDYWGNSLVAVKVGNYIEVTFGAPIYQGDDTISTHRNTEVYTEGSITDYKSVVMSNSINSIVKLTQAEYDALVSGGTVDSNTFYVIISNQS